MLTREKCLFLVITHQNLPSEKHNGLEARATRTSLPLAPGVRERIDKRENPFSFGLDFAVFLISQTAVTVAQREAACGVLKQNPWVQGVWKTHTRTHTK